jgi:hypothetical protein
MATFTFGPEGGPGGDVFDDRRLGQWVRIQIRAGDQVDALIVSYDSGVTVQHGGGGGRPVADFQLVSGEVITRIQGRHGSFVDQIEFLTNRRRLGPFGGTGGIPWALDVPPGLTVTSFFGASGTVLDRVGFVATDGLGP